MFGSVVGSSVGTEAGGSRPEAAQPSSGEAEKWLMLSFHWLNPEATYDKWMIKTYLKTLHKNIRP